jgi:glycosyltransferase involved in cell wall biosynthesis
MRALGDVAINTGGDVNLYHVGNNGLHREIYRRAIERPGVVVLHDAVLHHFFLGSLCEQGYIDEFTYNYGAWSEDLARSLWRNRARSAADPRYFRYSMLKRIAERSLAVIVHNPRAAEMVKECASAAIVEEVPHLFEAPELPSGYDTVRLRAELGIPPRTFLAGVFGHLRESKRLAVVLRACEPCDVSLLVAGDFVSADLARSMEPLLKQGRILRVPYTEERDFWRYASVVDACVNLRYPAAGETSGIAIRFMGIGKPVILSAGCETIRFPETSCLRVNQGAGEEDMLTDYLTWLASYPNDAHAIGERARAHISECHNPAKIASQYWRILERCYHKK